MSWSILSDESAKAKREKKRKRKIKRGSKRGRYIVLGSRARNGRKSPVRCVTCGNTVSSNLDGLVCSSCATTTKGKIEKYMDKMAPKPFKSQMTIPKMSEKK